MKIFHLVVWVVISFYAPLSSGNNYPSFNDDIKIEMLFLPFDTKPGSVVYRLQASDADRDYPLNFILDGGEKKLVELVPVSDTDANMVLVRNLTNFKNRIFFVMVSVKDTAGKSTTVSMRINITDASAGLGLVFESYPKDIVIPEDTEPNVPIGFVVAVPDDDMSRPPQLDIQGTDKFGLETIMQGRKQRGNIVLKEKLDFEKQNIYRFNITALGGRKNKMLDNRNIVVLPITVTVRDVQDTAPVFTKLPLLTRLRPDLTEGRVVVEIKAEDGDSTNKRPIFYSLEGPNSQNFMMNRTTGVVTLRRPLYEMRKSCQDTHIILKVKAEESGNRGPISASQEILLLIEDTPKFIPVFDTEKYSATIEENSPVFATIRFPKPPKLSTQREIPCGLFSLSLRNDGSNFNVKESFDIRPNMIFASGTFEIYVKNSNNLDYEMVKEVSFQVVALEVKSKNPSAVSSAVTVTILDVNDNAPQFKRSRYTAKIPENALKDTMVAQVQAVDSDSGNFGVIRYTKITGPKSEHFNLDRETGQVMFTATTPVLDRESEANLLLTIEACDNIGEGKCNTTELLVEVQDVNDNKPTFRFNSYKVCLPRNLFTGETFLSLEAVDKDEVGSLNSEIEYEITSGNLNNYFRIGPRGNLTITRPAVEIPPQSEGRPYEVVVRATDKGIPSQSSDVTVVVYTDAQNCEKRQMDFWMSEGKDEIIQNKEKMEKLLTAINGGAPTKIEAVAEMENLTPRRRRALLQNNISSKSRVTTVVVQHQDKAVIDVTAMQNHYSKAEQSRPVETDGQATVTVSRSSDAWKWVLIALLILLGLALLLLICCCLCKRSNNKKKSSKTYHNQSNNGKPEVIRIGTAGHRHGRRRYENGRVHHGDKGATTNGRDHLQGGNHQNGHLANVQYSRHMRDELGKSKGKAADGEAEEVIDPATGRRYYVRMENGRRVLLRSDEANERHGRKVTRGTNVTETALQADALTDDPNATLTIDQEIKNDQNHDAEDNHKTRLKNQFLEKKSLFTIAYDGMHSKHDVLNDRDDTTSPTAVS